MKARVMARLAAFFIRVPEKPISLPELAMRVVLSSCTMFRRLRSIAPSESLFISPPTGLFGPRENNSAFLSMKFRKSLERLTTCFTSSRARKLKGPMMIKTPRTEKTPARIFSEKGRLLLAALPC
ncbi:MAG TPA: hypothetical protein DCQ16_08000 [Spirochaetaceae bacterium]|nr:hypothetical protein [Spirochaetaceae bacterium]